jgi:hypothetical protein
MDRVNYTWTDGETEKLGWFDLDAATQIAEDATEWDGNNSISLASGSQWVRETLYRTAGGVHLIERRNRDTRIGPYGTTYHPISLEDAISWLRRCGHHDIADRIGGQELERGPGRPRIGTRRTVVIPDDLWEKLQGRAVERGNDVSTELRTLLSAALG